MSVCINIKFNFEQRISIELFSLYLGEFDRYTSDW